MTCPARNILVTSLSFSKYSGEPKKILEDNGFTLIWNEKNRPLKEEEMLDLLVRVRPVFALVVGVDPVTERIMDAAPELKVIAKHGVGVDNIDLAAAHKRGIIVTNTPGANNQAVADLVWGLILSAARDIPKADYTTRRGRWDRFIGCEVWGKTIGIIGVGQIGLAVAKRARGFNMRILGYDPVPNLGAAMEIGIEYTSLENLLKESDIVSLHAPLNSETYHLIDEQKLRLMKNSAILVNTARGDLVDEEALYRALKNGWIKAAALDVFSREPLLDSPLVELENVILTPHIGAYTYEANYRMGVAAAKSIVQVFKGEKPDFEV